MKTYNATIQHENGKIEAVTIAASDYTKAFLLLTYNNPKTTTILDLKEA
jgi:hypothetical protein